MSNVGFAQLLGLPGVREVSVLRSPFGFMAYHGGALEAMTDVIASEAAVRSGASYYGVIQPDDTHHISSVHIDPAASDQLATFIDRVEVVVTIHGFGRRGWFTSLLLGGRNRALAQHVGDHLRPLLPAYDIVTDTDRIPVDLRGMHALNPVNLPAQGGVQIELPPRVRGSSPLWWDWEGGMTPHTEALIDGLSNAALSWMG